MTNEEQLLDACRIAVAALGPADAAAYIQKIIDNVRSSQEINIIPLEDVLDQIKQEVETAESKWPPMNSAHEAYGVLMEEIDELWDHVKTNQKRRNIQEMRAESIQVAAMAVRFVRDICDSGRGRK